MGGGLGCAGAACQSFLSSGRDDGPIRFSIVTNDDTRSAALG